LRGESVDDNGSPKAVRKRVEHLDATFGGVDKWDNTGLNSASHLGIKRGSNLSSVALASSGPNYLEVNITNAVTPSKKQKEDQ
jgi:hypothetical protein